MAAGAPRSEEALAMITLALEQYPGPAGASALDAAMGAYALVYHSTHANTAKAAFAAVTPKVLERGHALVGRIMNAIADGRPAEPRADYMTAISELSTLATVFVGPPSAEFTGPYAIQYTEACELLKCLMSVAPA